MAEKRMIADYSVISSMTIGGKEIAIAENMMASENEKYLCCYVESNEIYERYLEGMVSDDYEEIVKIYGDRLSAAAEAVSKEKAIAREKVGVDDEITGKECMSISQEDSLDGKVIVIKGDILYPEYRRASHQLMLCTGGFGSYPNSRGRTCFCSSLYDGHSTSFYRSDVLGVMEEANLPQWAKDGLSKVRNQMTAQIDNKKDRGDAR